MTGLYTTDRRYHHTTPPISHGTQRASLDLALGNLDQEPGSDTFPSVPPDILTATSQQLTLLASRCTKKSEDASVITNTGQSYLHHNPLPSPREQQYGTCPPSRLTYIVHPFTIRHLGRRRQTKSPICCCSPPELPLSPTSIGAKTQGASPHLVSSPLR